ncbi:hypothetical protein [Streptomyces sp.]|uniref:hypothetical protein n=1 Tax=Streptomyces sp. TaxID=1931 RepID=UPI002811E970|nr:hypothetical protein [Streptomyces sp.]
MRTGKHRTTPRGAAIGALRSRLATAGGARRRLLVVAVLLAATGCNAMNHDALDYEPQHKTVAEAKELVRAQSSVVFDAAGLKKATATNNAPHVAPCDGVEHGYRVKHFWKIQGPSKTELSAALERLHAELPKRGWKVYRFDRAKSRNQQMQLEVEDTQQHHTAVVEEDFVPTGPDVSEWEKKGRDGLYVALDSPCYIDPAHTVGDQ